MYLSEVPKTESIIIAFDIKDKHFDFTTNLLPYADAEDPENTIYAEPIIILENALHIDNRCHHMEIRYLNPISGRLHVWKDVSIRYQRKPERSYIIKGNGDSTPVNRRHSVRISVGYRSSCTISMLDGKYPCVVNDISITGIGINVGSDLESKNLIHRLIYTYFEDDVLEKIFHVKARILHVFRMNPSTVRCGCEILSISPSINEYINVKQTHVLARASNYTDEALNAGLNDFEDESIAAAKKTEAAYIQKQPVAPAAPPQHDASYWLKDGGVCPVCEKGRLHFLTDAYYCDICGSILE
ncbi:MAG: PilZ domain-containing protein [Lachnospiraceae bacterium]|nr:PilZ domain-containing protein [Lachnospiraceae bacterium]